MVFGKKDAIVAYFLILFIYIWQFIITGMYKQFFNRAKAAVIYFQLNSHGYEVNCVIEQADIVLPIEIKASMTFDKKFIDSLIYWNNIASYQKSVLVYGGNEEFNLKDCTVRSWQKFKVYILTDCYHLKLSP